jgi:Ca2+/H+ antiporter
MLLWLFLAVILVTAPPLLIVGWLQLQHMRKQGPLKARQIIVLTIALMPAAFGVIQ